MRIVSICPSNTELLAYLGAVHEIVGVDNFSDWPKEIDHLPRLGPDLDIDMDAVEELNPDLVVASLSVPGMEKNITQLKERGLSYIVLNPNSLEDIGDSLLTLGKRIGREEIAVNIRQQYRRFIELYKSKSEEVTHRPLLYWEWWAKPVFTPGRKNWLTDLSELAGGRNAFATEPQASVQTSWEDVAKRDPDHICLVWVGVQQNRVKPAIVYKRVEFKDITAVKRNQVHVLDEPLYCRPSPRLLTGLMKLAALLHPTIYPDYVEGDEWQDIQ
ncbi:cobalamin-binding protein [Caldalkalibacillus salinus]|uniref:cobalamin-binding protein n=1 Tax=Caldalkalibacillus salinus TaxID=2803787 RepID=UPI001921C26E|nr:cobalamin-binding protein [Caldalkalibacillus salinus]